MIIIGVDPHKASHTATVLEGTTSTELGTLRITASLQDYQRLLAWAGAWVPRQWAIENADGLGHHLAQWLLAHGEEVLDVPPTATARFRSLSRGGRRKNDRIDAAAAAGSAAVHGDSRRVFPEDHTDALALLAERRQSLSQHRTRLLNQLHALLRELIPGGAPRSLTATRAAQLLRRVRPTGTADRVRREVARDLIAEVRHHDRLVAANTEQIRKMLIEHPTTLTEIVGIGPVLAARILAGAGNPRRFPTAAAFANYSGTAPIQIASAEHSRHRLSRYGNRDLNSAIHSVAIIQIRTPSSAGYAYYAKKRDEGKTPREAIRCLKRQLASTIWRAMTNDCAGPPVQITQPMVMAA
ncbi:IS110 family transposase [Kocuria dechangensis]|uniref:IS110 family transposase n=1 Tax=Kocuria dechangensis TaxID=1176249 RepID=A0A917M0S6_9MICC|nr:IS110 family transposase [Kocuria dechangensis]GGG70458.1 IS110 family transposase [Kocuria dechangensis]